MIYLSSGMQKFGKERLHEGDEWRQKLIYELIGLYGYNKEDFFNPNDYYSFADDDINELEIMKYDLFRLGKSDLLIYCATDPYSLGSMAEIAIAYEKQIPILVLNEKNVNLHSWIRNMANKEFTNMDSLINYLTYYYKKGDF